jgi:hypothetical protein
MTLDRVASTLNELLSRKRPAIVNSSWILRHAPACYRFIQKWIRSEIGGIDWDRVTHVLDRYINDDGSRNGEGGLPPMLMPMS